MFPKSLWRGLEPLVTSRGWRRVNHESETLRSNKGHKLLPFPGNLGALHSRSEIDNRLSSGMGICRFIRGI